MIDTAKFKSPSELFKFLKENKALLIAEKKSTYKRADAVSFCRPIHEHEEGADKAAPTVQDLTTKDVLNVEIVINTTKLLDSHGDVHIDGLWKKSLKEQRSLYHIQEHRMQFDHVISDNVSARTEVKTWRELGFKMNGDTEALIFESKIEKLRNPYMFEQYARGYVKNHSVGMRYIAIYLCINSEEKYYVEEKANWDKYFPIIANPKDAEATGFFWAVTEAQVVEGSAVLSGSNWATPTTSVKFYEPSEDTQENDLGPVTPPEQKAGLFDKLININN